MSDHHKDEPSNFNQPVDSRRRKDYLFVILLLLALLSALLAFLIFAAVFLSSLFGIPLTIFVPRQILSPVNQLYVAAGLLLVLAFIFVLLARWRIRRNRAYRYASGCPVCLQHDMIRVHRSRWHRLSADLLRLPIRKYACRNCQWQGILLYYPLEVPQVADDATPLPVPAVPNQSDEQITDDKDLVIQSILASTGRQDQDPSDTKAGPIASMESEGADEALSVHSIDTPVDDNDQILSETHALPVDPEETPPQEKLFPPPVGEQHSFTTEGDIAAAESHIGGDISDVRQEQEISPSRSGITDRLPKDESNSENDHLLADPPLHGEQNYGEGFKGRAIVVSPFGLSLRTAPSNTAEIILSLDSDSVVELLEVEDQNAPINWRQVRFDGETGWVSAAFLRLLQD